MIVKWAGGKRKLLPELLARMPKFFRRYHEPFFGGGALFFALTGALALEVGRVKKTLAQLTEYAPILSDRNAELIYMYRAVAADWWLVSQHLDAHSIAHCREHYEGIRSLFNLRAREVRERIWRTETSAQAARLIYLNKTCYNGLWRENLAGDFNVPIGVRKSHPRLYTAKTLEAAAGALYTACLGECDYRLSCERVERGDFVYLDPPYHTPGDAFTRYTSEGFAEEDHRQLHAEFVRMADRGAMVLLSNSETRLVRKLYRGHRIERVWCGRSINSKASERGAVPELLIRNY